MIEVPATSAGTAAVPAIVTEVVVYCTAFVVKPGLVPLVPLEPAAPVVPDFPDENPGAEVPEVPDEPDDPDDPFVPFADHAILYVLPVENVPLADTALNEKP